jgi:hypothetical protein
MRPSGCSARPHPAGPWPWHRGRLRNSGPWHSLSGHPGSARRATRRGSDDSALESRKASRPQTENGWRKPGDIARCRHAWSCRGAPAHHRQIFQGVIPRSDVPPRFDVAVFATTQTRAASERAVRSAPDGATVRQKMRQGWKSAKVSVHSGRSIYRYVTRCWSADFAAVCPAEPDSVPSAIVISYPYDTGLEASPHHAEPSNFVPILFHYRRPEVMLKFKVRHAFVDCRRERSQA